MVTIDTQDWHTVGVYSTGRDVPGAIGLDFGCRLKAENGRDTVLIKARLLKHGTGLAGHNWRAEPGWLACGSQALTDIRVGDVYEFQLRIDPNSRRHSPVLVDSVRMEPAYKPMLVLA